MTHPPFPSKGSTVVLSLHQSTQTVVIRGKIKMTQELVYDIRNLFLKIRVDSILTVNYYRLSILASLWTETCRNQRYDVHIHLNLHYSLRLPNHRASMSSFLDRRGSSLQGVNRTSVGSFECLGIEISKENFLRINQFLLILIPYRNIIIPIFSIEEME